MNKKLNFVLLLSALFCSSAFAAQAQTTAFTYQGHFTDATVAQPTNGTYNMQFALYDGSNVQQPQPTPVTITNNSVVVTNGVFTVSLDFGASPFTSGADRFLEIRVFSTATSSYVTLAPRQQLTSSPFSIRTISAGAADMLSNLCIGCVDDAKIGTVSGSKVTGTVPNATTATSFSGALAGDVTGTQSATVVSNVGGQTASNVATATTAANSAASANTASAIVRRDSSGNFSAGTITATMFNGNATSASNATQLGGVAPSQYVVTGDSRLSDARTPTGTAGGSLSGTYPNPTLGAGVVGPANFAKVPYAMVRNTATQNFPTSGSFDEVELNNVRDSWDIIFDNATDHLIVQTAGLYAISGQINWLPNPNGWRGLEIQASGNEICSIIVQAAATGDTVLSCTSLQRMQVGDVIDMQAGQGSGGPVSSDFFDYGSAQLYVHWVGP